MKAVTSNALVFAILAGLACGCGGDSANNDGDNTGGTPEAGTNAGEKDSGGGPGGGGDGGGGNGDLPPASACGAQSDGTPLDTSDQGGCYYFYCYQTEAQLRAAAKDGACANDKDVALQCDGEPVRAVAQCARDNVAVLGSMPIETREERYAQAVRDCARKNAKLKDFSEACLGCNVDSAVCAANKCFAQCAAGDSKSCDDCRESNDCTPSFYTCAGYPDPKK